MTNNDHSNLAGAHCPNCNEVCVYEISEELARSPLDTIPVSCHACGHVFQTALPDDARLPAEDVQPSQIEEDRPDGLTNISPLPDDAYDLTMDEREVSTAQPKTADIPSARAPYLKYGITAGVMIVILCIGGFIMVNTSSSMRHDALAGLEEAAKPKPIAIEQTLAPKAKAVVTTDQAETKTSTPPSISTGPQFVVTDRGYTISTSDLGTIMNIKVSIVNKGNTHAKPEKMILHLLSEDGVILMTWPMMNANADLIAPQTSRLYSAQLIEPPQGAKTLEVEIQ